jgi:hypothetical protein
VFDGVEIRHPSQPTNNRPLPDARGEPPLAQSQLHPVDHLTPSRIGAEFDCLAMILEPIWPVQTVQAVPQQLSEFTPSDKAVTTSAPTPSVAHPPALFAGTSRRRTTRRKSTRRVSRKGWLSAEALTCGKSMEPPVLEPVTPRCQERADAVSRQDRPRTVVWAASLGQQLSSELSSRLSSAHRAKRRHSHRFLIPGDPALTIGCVKGGEAITW